MINGCRSGPWPGPRKNWPYCLGVDLIGLAGALPRGVLPKLLRVLAFRCDNTAFQPLMDALALAMSST